MANLRSVRTIDDYSALHPYEPGTFVHSRDLIERAASHRDRYAPKMMQGRKHTEDELDATESLISRYPAHVVEHAISEGESVFLAAGLVDAGLCDPGIAARILERDEKNAEDREKYIKTLRRDLLQKERDRALQRLRDEGRRLGLPDHAAKAVAHGRIDRTRPIKAVEEWITSAESSPILVLLGPKGVGKTVGAARALASIVDTEKDLETAEGRLNRFRLRFREVVCMRPDDLVRALSPTRFADGEEVEHLTDADLVVLDELGSEQHPQFEAAFRDLIDRRADKRTVATGNMRKHKLGNYDELIVDRLEQLAHVVECGGQSLRVARAGIRAAAKKERSR